MLDDLTSDVVVVGAGVSGLAAACELSSRLQTIVVDRLPVIGGIDAGYEEELVVSLKRRCDRSGVRFLLGTTALRWSPERRLLVAGPAGIKWLAAHHLVYAGGTRPSTQAELGITGDRLGGVMPSTVAYHLLEAGVRLGERVVVLGASDWAARVTRQLVKQGCHVSVIPMSEPASRPPYADAWWPRWKPVSLHGRGRVREILLACDGQREKLLCDAVILAAQMRPMRNIDGAIFENMSEAVTFVQLVSDMASHEQRAENARRIASNLEVDPGRESI